MAELTEERVREILIEELKKKEQEDARNKAPHLILYYFDLGKEPELRMIPPQVIKKRFSQP